MKKIHEYLEHAAECRRMARVASKSHKAELEEMADAWEQLAETRRRRLRREDKAEADKASQ